MKFTAILLLLVLVTMSSVATSSYPSKHDKYPSKYDKYPSKYDKYPSKYDKYPYRRGCSNRCYKWRPSSNRCGRFCRPRRTVCRIRKVVTRCHFVYRRWGKKKVCKDVTVYREHRAWKCRPRFNRPYPRPHPHSRPPFARCMNKCKPYWSQAKNGCDYRFCYLKRCAVPWPRSKVREHGWGCFYKAGGEHPVKPEYPVKPVYPVHPKPPVYKPPVIVKPDPYNKCFNGCHPLHKARHGCNESYCAVRPCASGYYMCMPKMPHTPKPYTPPTPPSTDPKPGVTYPPTTTASSCEKICYPTEKKEYVTKSCNELYCRVVDCIAKGKGFKGFGCISKA